MRLKEINPSGIDSGRRKGIYLRIYLFFEFDCRGADLLLQSQPGAVIIPEKGRRHQKAR